MDWHLDIHRLYELLSKMNLPSDQFPRLPSTHRIGKAVTQVLRGTLNASLVAVGLTLFSSNTSPKKKY